MTKNTIQTRIETKFKRRKDTVQAQGRIDKDLYKRVDAKRRKLGISWPTLIESCFEEYLGVPTTATTTEVKRRSA